MSFPLRTLLSRVFGDHIGPDNRGGYRYTRIHEEGGLVVGGGVVISWVVVSSLFVEDNDVTVELQLRIGCVWGVLVRTVVSEAGWRGGDEPSRLNKCDCWCCASFLRRLRM